MVEKAPPIFEALNELNPGEAEPSILNSAYKNAELAANELRDGLSTLHAFGALALWSWLESYVLDLVVLWVHRRPSSLKHIGNAKVRIDLMDLVHLKGEQKARYVVEQIDREFGGPLREGNGRFDHLLKAVGFKVALDENNRKLLFEFQQVRNCLAHRGGIADHRLVSACPWLNLTVGDKVLISRATFQSYGEVTSSYLLETLYAGATAMGLKTRENVEKKLASTRKNKEFGKSEFTQ